MSETVLERIKRGTRLAFFGLGKSNLSLIRSLPLDKCKVTLRSDKALSEKDIACDVKWERILVGESSCLDIDEEIMIFSPSVRRERKSLLAAKERGVIFTSDLEIFLEENTRPMLAVSGSDGKSTTSTLLGLMADNSLLIGNIGNPMVEALGKEASLYVAELSSFMLRYANVKAKRACITNITPNHLDWHESFEEYVGTKLSLLKGSDECVINADDAAC
ncbi:MAG: hypothetical protein IKY62_00160, partial [Clostridia bacterium]|nr:hypothetical protein [Clostridia bacterium]